MTALIECLMITGKRNNVNKIDQHINGTRKEKIDPEDKLAASMKLKMYSEGEIDRIRLSTKQFPSKFVNLNNDANDV
ncbi:unnamed protein product [Enterobius vermicularis]|uniref:Uncharacterized protein n=1 Tax=Enterobius vermicularis TaxID=51028 RepID=A0A0N4V4E1_ENTVE|nr:unnamed protein product [Enterobius vermicularis]